ncbi:DUF4244 domain-containing protein, partial [Clavibacter michiganensis]
MGRVEERAHPIDVRDVEVAAARGHGSGTMGAAVAPEGRAVWPLAAAGAAPVAPSRPSGRGMGCAGACGAEVVTAVPRLAPSRSARVARAARRALLR